MHYHSGPVGGGEQGGSAAHVGAGERGPERDGGHDQRGRRGRPACIEQRPEVGGERGVGVSLVAAPGVELPQRAGVGRAGVGGQGVVGQPAGCRGGRGEGGTGDDGEGLARAIGVCIFNHNGS